MTDQEIQTLVDHTRDVVANNEPSHAYLLTKLADAVAQLRRERDFLRLKEATRFDGG